MNAVSANLSTLEQFLRLTTARQEAISSNMANVDTPGYRTRDVDFQAELKKAMEPSGVILQNAGFSLPPRNPTTLVQGLMERPDGNNVNLDREGLLLAQTQLQYLMGIQLLKGQFHGLMSAINGGS